MGSVDEGLLKKVAYEERPPRYEYRLTDKGRAFSGRSRRDVAMGQRLAWGEDGPKVALIDRGTGSESANLVNENARQWSRRPPPRWVESRTSIRLRESRMARCRSGFEY